MKMIKETTKSIYTATFKHSHSDLVIERMNKRDGRTSYSITPVSVVANSKKGLVNQLLLQGYEVVQ